jgi:SAM-dependent methyltransferase
MAHIQQFQFFACISKHYPNFFLEGKVSEIGSLNINGSIRDFFKAVEYTGFDVAAGPGVDEVQQGQLITSPTGYYDVTVSAECFEHNPYWVETFANMLRITKPGGLIIFSCATTGRQEHGTVRTSPHDSPLTNKLGWSYYKNLDANNFLDTFNMSGWFDGYHFLMCPQTYDLYFYGFRSHQIDSFDHEIFIKNIETIEKEIYAVNNGVRIGVWTNKIGWVPR